MGSMSIFAMNPKVLLPSKPAYTNVEAPTRLANMVTYSRKVRLVAVHATPDKIAESIEQSIKTAQETCSENPESGECVAAWDEVEEISAAASHARDKTKPNDPLETYCQDNPETAECRTYDN
ncbi:calvin cycle protein CP12-1, chloroplastic-like [Silene latifolia]|uniref:calvin cycle protein CP12-1, chloroplastic-like n=1 Tax=Silene latifolia TaxID=37657 RepID=UPI003D787926